MPPVYVVDKISCPNCAGVFIETPLIRKNKREMAVHVFFSFGSFVEAQRQLKKVGIGLRREYY